MTINKATALLKSLQVENGLFLAAPSSQTGYNKAWIRDNLYESLGIELINPEEAVKIVHKLSDIFKKHEYKIDWAIKEKPDIAYKYIHARYHPETLDEFYDEWGNKQNDAVGLFLFRVADLMDKGLKVIRDNDDARIVEKLILYLGSIEYWHDADNGIWEEKEEIHASSVGACLAGLKRISKYFFVPEDLIANGENNLDNLLPKESKTKEVDLALLSLVFPYNVLDEEQKKQILENVERELVRNKGLIRYKGD